MELALAARDGARVQRERLVRPRASAANLRRVRSAVELGAEGRTSELGARLEQIRAQRAVIDADVAFQQSLADLDAALGAPLAGVEPPRRGGGDRRAPGSGS